MNCEDYVLILVCAFQVFKLVSGHVTLASLKLILEVLEPKTSKDELMEAEEEEGESDEGSGEDSDGGDGEHSKDEGDSLVSEDSEGGPGEEVDPVFRAEVQKALGAAAVDSDAQASVYTSVTESLYPVLVYSSHDTICVNTKCSCHWKRRLVLKLPCWTCTCRALVAIVTSDSWFNF